MLPLNPKNISIQQKCNHKYFIVGDVLGLHFHKHENMFTVNVNDKLHMLIKNESIKCTQTRDFFFIWYLVIQSTNIIKKGTLIFTV